MSEFNPMQALDICTANINKRKESRKPQVEYVLRYYRNREELRGGKGEMLVGSTIKGIIDEFRKFGGQYSIAFVTRKNENKVLRYFDRNESSKFFSMTRTGFAKKKSA